LSVEQINNSTGTVTYLHHDQAGSTRLLTGSTGTVEGAYSYSPYGTPEHTGTATTPLGYDGQYTSSDTGLVYMRARVYDPSTAQFLTRDPLAAVSGEPYSYAGDDPLNESDPTGLLFGINLPSWEEAGEAVAGWGDTITFGATEWVREQIGDNNIDACSGAYQSGGVAGLVTGALIPGEDDAEAAELGVEGVDDGELATTPEGRPYSAHYLNDTGPVRNIPGSVVDETITQATETTDLGDRTVYYDAKNDVTVVQSNTTGKIMSVRKGEP
jgi:RHS repeat-associated protein